MSGDGSLIGEPTPSCETASLSQRERAGVRGSLLPVESSRPSGMEDCPAAIISAPDATPAAPFPVAIRWGGNFLAATGCSDDARALIQCLAGTLRLGTIETSDPRSEKLARSLPADLAAIMRNSREAAVLMTGGIGLTQRPAHKLARVEAGAQGDHKLARGYMPVATYSAHWIAEPGFKQAVARFLDEERDAVARRIEALEDWGPFKKEQQD